jgi:predicted  nucleic acid-binding Zn-ribbon protein
LAEREELRRELIRLRQAVRNETQMSRRVALNLEIQRWEQRLAALHAQL